MKKVLKITLYVLASLAFIALAGIAYLKWALPNVGPAPELTVEITPERLERGEYLANHVMLCMDCHAERDWSLFSGPPRPGTEGTGGDRFDHDMGFPGIFYARNITPAGISDWTDGELYRLITTGVRKDGEPIFPVMPYLNYGKMDEEDIKSVIAYIRTLEPVESVLPPSAPDFPFNLILRTMPVKASPQPMPSPADQIAYGEYLVNAAACGDCHTRFEGGQFVGEYLAGGREFAFPDGSVLRSSNLTPHETGLESWTRETFVNRFKMYADSAYVLPAVQPGQFQSIMPWVMYAGMETTDLEAIYAYLQTLAPVEQRVERFVAAKQGK
jgi:mono/diheme cytochrome c family protein